MNNKALEKNIEYLLNSLILFLNNKMDTTESTIQPPGKNHDYIINMSST